jgi:integrase
MSSATGVPVDIPSRVRPWSADEARAFLESVRHRADPLYAGYVLILVLGLRRGEMLGLRWEDVDFDNAELSIGWQIQRISRQLLHRQTKTETSDAVLPLVPICETALHERAAAQASDKEAAGGRWAASDLVFTTRTGRPVEPRNFNRSFTTACERAGVRVIPVHATRKTCASLLVALDVHPRVAMQVLRHSQISVTMDVYAEVSSEATRRALKRLGKRLDGRR